MHDPFQLSQDTAGFNLRHPRFHSQRRAENCPRGSLAQRQYQTDPFNYPQRKLLIALIPFHPGTSTAQKIVQDTYVGVRFSQLEDPMPG